MAKKVAPKKKAAKKPAKKAAKTALTGMAEALLTGKIKVIDLTATLGPETPLIKLPPSIGLNTPPIEIHTISHYDDKGPFWAWNWLKLGEHSGTHFDAPVHWITGKALPRNSVDPLAPADFIPGHGPCPGVWPRRPGRTACHGCRAGWRIRAPAPRPPQWPRRAAAQPADPAPRPRCTAG